MKITIQHYSSDGSENNSIIEISFTHKVSKSVPQKDYLSSVEVSEAYGLSHVVLEDLIRAGKIHYMKAKDRYIISRFAVEKWLKENEL